MEGFPGDPSHRGSGKRGKESGVYIFCRSAGRNSAWAEVSRQGTGAENVVCQNCTIASLEDETPAKVPLYGRPGDCLVLEILL
jgi:hypothetical protein